MQIIKLKSVARIPRQTLNLIIKTLKTGGVIAFPTETTYGLGCDPRNIKAIEKIYKMKGREKGKPFPLVAASVAQVRQVAMLQAISYKLQAQYWPGSLTLVLPVRPTAHLAHQIAPHGEVAIRVSSHLIVQQITRAFGFPIVATSANKSGKSECRSGRAVARAFACRCRACTCPYACDAPDLILDAGALPRRKPSTIVRITTDGSVEILRQGAVRLKRL